jgi:hypothetical protein
MEVYSCYVDDALYASERYFSDFDLADKDAREIAGMLHTNVVVFVHRDGGSKEPLTIWAHA